MRALVARMCVMFRPTHVHGLLLLVLLGAIGFMLWSFEGSPGLVPAPLVPGLAADGDEPGLMGGRSISKDQVISDASDATGSSPARSTEGEYWRWIRGEVRSKLTQVPIEGGQVRINDGSRQGEAVTDADGSFEIEWLGADHFTMSLFAPGFEQREHPGMNWDEEPLELEMNPLGVVFGTFEWPTGLMLEPFGEVQFFRGALSNAARKPAHVLSLTAEPHFKAQLSAGTWSLALHRRDQSSSFETSFEVRMGEETTLHLPLSPSLIYRGKVVFKLGNEGVPGVALDLRQEVAGVSRAVRRSLQLSCVSAEDGSFAFEGLSPGKVLISLRTPWGQVLRLSHVLSAQNSGRTERVVVAPSGSISGFVRDHAGQPVTQQEVRLVPNNASDLGDGRYGQLRGDAARGDSELVQQTTTDGQGRFVFDQVAANRPVCLQVRPHPHLVAEVQVTVPEGSIRDNVQITLGQVSSFVVRVRDPQGQTLEGALVVLRMAGGISLFTSGFRPQALTDSQGEAHFDLAPKDLELAQVTRDGWVRGKIDLVPGGIAEVVMQPAVIVRGVVRDSDGWVVPGLLVSATEEFGARSSSGPYKRTIAGPDGSFEFVGFYTIDILIRASGSGWIQKTEHRIQVQPGTSHEIILTVQRKLSMDPGSLRVEGVRKGSGDPVPGLSMTGLGNCTVALVGPELWITGVRPGRYTPVLSAPGFEQLRLNPVDVLSADSINLGRIELRRAVQVEVRVRDAEGKSVPRARVVFSELAKEQDGEVVSARWKARTDAQGRATFKRLPRERLRLTVSHRSSKKYSDVVRIKDTKGPIEVRLKSR